MAENRERRVHFPRSMFLSVTPLVLGVVAAGGCAGVFGSDGTSVSSGSHANGSLRQPALLPKAGDGYVIPSPWRERQSSFGSDELVWALVRATRAVARAYPGSVAAIGDLSRRGGGGSLEHKSHQSGRDVDIVYYGVSPTGRPEPPRGVMLHYDRTGRAVRWSPPLGAIAPTTPVPDVRFDARRNWRLIRSLLRDPDIEVQWIFVERDLAGKLIAQGVAEREDSALLARAFQIIRQPMDSEPHDDHMHVRIYCDGGDRWMGCVDHGPERWWKKRWKDMTAPFGRAAGADANPGLLELLRERIPLTVTPARLTS